MREATQAPCETWQVHCVPQPLLSLSSSPLPFSLQVAVDEQGAVTCASLGNLLHDDAAFARKHNARLLAAKPGQSSAAAEELADYLAGKRRRFDAPLRLLGTEFQVKVWHALLRLDFGETTSYGELARKMEQPKAVRAVAMAAGANPIVVMVPCHRLIASGQQLGGFSGGLAAKRWLLQHEATVIGRSCPFSQTQLALGFKVDDCTLGVRPKDGEGEYVG